MDDLQEEKYNGNITFLFNENGATLDLQDESSRIRFVSIELNADQVCRMFSREACVPCTINTVRLDKVGKKLTIDHIKFTIPDHDYKERDEVAYREALKHCPEGWEVSNYFGSKDSFGWNQDGSKFARATIRRWENPTDSGSGKGN